MKRYEEINDLIMEIWDCLMYIDYYGTIAIEKVLSKEYQEKFLHSLEKAQDCCKKIREICFEIIKKEVKECT